MAFPEVSRLGDHQKAVSGQLSAVSKSEILKILGFTES
jgi:hypothetical protein